MNAALRHVSVRLWLTALVGGMAGIFILPWWQTPLGVDGLVFPAFVIMVGCFAAVGWGMNRIGMGFLNRHVNEATAWERAGMMAEAETAFQKALATYDSFWLSPLMRQGRGQWFSSMVAKFYLGQNSRQPLIRSLISNHLKNYPHDKAIAEPWLEQLLMYERHLPLEHDAAASVGAHFSEHPRMQRLLMQFYLANGRIDFDAIQTYRRVWNEQQPLPDTLLTGLSRLLCNECYLNAWALQVYLKAYQQGDQKAIEGIAAAVRWLPESEESRGCLVKADKILGALDPQHMEQVNSRFKPVHLSQSIDEPIQFENDPKPIDHRQPSLLFNGFGKTVNRLILRTGGPLSKLSLQRTALWIAAGTGITVAPLLGWHLLNPPSDKEATKAVVNVPIQITDPFTIQVAAYLKAKDAQRFVDQLRQNELDAFWTRATNSANRTWYQVKVSHFADRQGAEKYGQELKSKGLIDDFYVANYVHGQRAEPKK